mgnify:CR=1 FL=1
MSQELIDPFGRLIQDLRISITDRCNFRCTYCMPEEGMQWLARSEVMRFEEIERLARIFVERYGVRGIRLTGGEPTVRAHLPVLVEKLAAIVGPDGPVDLAMTTNGAAMRLVADTLREAGLRRVNISLDTLDRAKFHRMTRRDELPRVLDGIEAAKEAGFDPVKINAVLMRGINDDEAPRLLRWALDRGYEMRFIEQMPLDPQHGWNRRDMVTAAEILTSLASEFQLTPVGADERGSAPAETWLVDGGSARVGVIGSVTRPFCGACDRTRLTADGQVRTCLFARTESDLRAPLRHGASDADLARRWRVAMAGKLPGHGIDDPGFLQPTRPMSAIGG